MNKLIVGIIVVVIVGAALFFVGSSRPAAPVATNGGQSTPQAEAIPNPTREAAAPSPANQAPQFSLKDYSGKTVSTADFKGKPLVINSWASWCPFCRQELPDFVTAQREFGDKVVFIAIDRQEDLRTAKGYTDTQGTSKGLIFLLDPADSFYQSIGGFSMPETIFVDKNGDIVVHKRGPMDLTEIRERTEKIIASASTSPNKTAAEDTVVTYGESGFSPSILRVKVGTTIIFKNDEAGPLWVASNPHPVHTDYPGFDATRGHAKGETYSFTFTTQGTWKYHNHLSPSEGGVIVVE